MAGILLLIVQVVPEESATTKVESKSDRELAYGLAQNHLAHAYGNEAGRLPLRLSVQDGTRRRVGGEGKGGESVHDEVNPEKLHSIQDCLACYSGNKSQDDGGDVDRKLELEKQPVSSELLRRLQ